MTQVESARLEELEWALANVPKDADDVCITLLIYASR